MAEITPELLLQIQEQAWSQGYRACYEGRQNHNPYRKVDPNENKVALKDLLQ